MVVVELPKKTAQKKQNHTAAGWADADVVKKRAHGRLQRLYDDDDDDDDALHRPCVFVVRLSVNSRIWLKWEITTTAAVAGTCTYRCCCCSSTPYA